MRDIVTTIAASAGLLVLLAGCMTNGTARTADAAERLERVATSYAAASNVSAAQAFADQAREFHGTLGQEGAAGVLLAYQRLWRGYHTLRHEVNQSGDPSLRTELSPTTDAFYDVQQHIRAWYSDADTGLYSRGGYTLDPYYN